MKNIFDMKKIFVTLALTGCILPAFANLNGNGFYRVRNYGSLRWGTLVDNSTNVDVFAANADLHSLQLTKNTEQILSDPGSVIYITNIKGSQYDVASQGVSLENLVENTISIGDNGSAPDGQTLYVIYGTYKGATKYIGDANLQTSQEEGYASINVTNKDFTKWYILPMDVNSENYFGAVPSVNADGKLYTSLFTSFAYKPYSSGVKAYYISRVGYGMAEMVEIDGAVPPGSPVIIQCAGNNVADNKLEIQQLQDALPANALTGVYFNYDTPTVQNFVKYDPTTMRVLGRCSDGSLGFIIDESLENIPANTAYLEVPAGSSPEIKCVSSETYESNLPYAPEDFHFSDSFVILPQGDGTYYGSGEIPAVEGEDKDLKLRFYTSSSRADEEYIAPVGEDEYILANNENEALPFGYDTPYYWIIRNWMGGDLAVTINLPYQYVKIYSKNAGVDTVLSGENKLIFIDGKVYCESASEIKLYDLSGKLLLKSKGSSMDVSNLPSGIYIALANGNSIKIAL